MKTTLLVAILVLVAPAAAHAQTHGQVRGVVINGETGRGLVGVDVIVAETRQGDATAREGRFLIDRVVPGTYTIVAHRIGFGTARTTVSVEAGQATDVELVIVQEAIDLEEVLAVADRPYTAASSRTLRAFDLLTRPTRTSQDLLNLMPGLVTAQHAGGGKAEQIFLRGFDADHGTDVHISVDGMPVNMVSHGHGHGYADLHFLIPEVVERMDVTKGPYDARYGNMATAGAVAFTTRDHLDNNMLRVEGGSFNTVSVTGLYQIALPDVEHQGAYLAGQFYNTDGPVESPQGFQRFNLFGKFHTHLHEHAQLSLSASGFSSAWDASGQIPERAIASGQIDRFGSIDDFEGGTTGRQDVNLTYEADHDGEEFVIQGYATRYNFKLFSNFTFFLEDPERGDMIEQTDRRNLLGFNAHYRRQHGVGSMLGVATLGGGFRSDDVDLSLWRSPDRVRLEALADAAVTERNLYLWAQEELVVSPWLRMQVGLRGDYFTFNVDDHLEGQPADLPHASGYAQQAVLSPKVNVVVSPASHVDLFANFGTSFHSNDARDIVLGQRVRDLAKGYRRDGLSESEINERLTTLNFDPAQQSVGTLPVAVGGELGVRTRPVERLNLAAAAWLLDLDQEFVYVGDGGYAELSGATRRYGLDLEARLSLTSWLSTDADVNFSRGRFVDEPGDANAIPLAPTVTSTGGLTVLHPRGYEGSLRYVYVGDRAANEAETVTAQGFMLVNLMSAYRFGRVRVNMTLENVLDVEWNEAQFDTESRLAGEAASVSELHFTPGNPRTIRLGLSYLF